MLGFGKKNDQQDPQIPYTVYETVRQPEARRRQWILRLIATQAVVTLLIVGGMALVRSLRDDDQTADNQQTQSQEEQSSGEGGSPSGTPSPQPEPAPQPAEPAPTGNTPGGERNDETIRKPD